MSKNPDWNDVGEEEEEVNRTPHYENAKEIKIVNKTLADGSIVKDEQTYLIKKWVFPVRRQVLKRKEMTKFGDVKDIPKGSHKPGDFQVESEVKIETEEKAEIGIVNQLEKMNTESMMYNRQKLKLEEMNKTEDSKAQKTANASTNKDDKYKNMFKDSTAGQAFSIKISDITPYETSLKNIEEEFTEYLDHLFKDELYYRITLSKSKDNPPRFLKKCFLNFNDEATAEKALARLENAYFNDVQLQVEKAAAPPRKK